MASLLLLALLALHAAAGAAMLMPLRARALQRPHRCTTQRMLFSEGDRLAESKAKAQKNLEKVQAAAKEKQHLFAASEEELAQRKVLLKEAQTALERAMNEMNAAKHVHEKMAAEQQAAQADIDAAQAALDEATEEAETWARENPFEAAGDAFVSAGAEVAAASVEAAGTALLTSLFGEPKSVREAKEKERAAKRAQQQAEREKAEREAAAKAQAVADKAAADAKAAEERRAAEEAAAAAEEARKAAEAERIDADLRRKREEAKQQLKQQRDRKLSDTIATGLADAALGALGGDSEWATERREKLAREAQTREKLNKLSLFEPDLELLGLRLEDAAELDEKALRKAFRVRSRELHPDAAIGRESELQGVPSVYELNAAFENLKKLV